MIGCEDRLRNDLGLYCVEWDVKLYSNLLTFVVGFTGNSLVLFAIGRLQPEVVFTESASSNVFQMCPPLTPHFLICRTKIPIYDVTGSGSSFYRMSLEVGVLNISRMSPVLTLLSPASRPFSHPNLHTPSTPPPRRICWLLYQLLSAR